jgi:hypothetical protein
MAGATTLSDAQRVDGIVRSVLDDFRSLEGFSGVPVRVHLTPERLFRADLAGVTLRRTGGDTWIAVRSDVQNVPGSIAHELVHACFGEIHDYLPTVLEEGLCELLAERIFPDERETQSRLMLAAAGYLDRFTVHVMGGNAKEGLKFLVGDVAPIEEVLTHTWRDHLEAGDRTRQNNYGFGWVLARVIGFDGLVALVHKCRAEGLDVVPVPWILAAAGLDPLNQENLGIAFARAMGVEPNSDEWIVITLTGE